MSRKFIRLGTAIQIGDDLSGCKIQPNLNNIGSIVTSARLIPQTICFDTSTGIINYMADNGQIQFIKTSYQMLVNISASNTSNNWVTLCSFYDGDSAPTYDTSYTIPSDFGTIYDISVSGDTSNLQTIMNRYPFFKFEKNASSGTRYIFDLFNRIWSFVLLLRTYRMIIIQPFYYPYTTTDSTSFTVKSGFTRHSGITPISGIWANTLFFYDYCDKSSNFTAGNITNTAFTNVSVPQRKTYNKIHPFYDIIDVWTRYCTSGGSGGIKSLSLSNLSTANNKISFDVQVNSVQTADKLAALVNFAVIVYKDTMR